MNAKDDLAKAQRELRNLSEQREVLDRRIKGLVTVIDGLKMMANEEAISELIPVIPAIERMGITDAVRYYLQDFSCGPVFPTEIRDAMIVSGRTETPQDLLLAVHSVLSRMEKAGEIEPVERDGKKAYLWVSVLKRAVERMGKLSDMNPTSRGALALLNTINSQPDQLPRKEYSPTPRIHKKVQK
jgi:hypothetical protein